MLIALDEHDTRPLYQQMVAQVKEQVQRGELAPGDELPPVRELAGSLGVNLHTVRNAYGKLRDQGVIEMRLGRRARIARLPSPAASPSQVGRVLDPQIRELVADAFLLGVRPTELHAMIDRRFSGRSNDVFAAPTKEKE